MPDARSRPFQEAARRQPQRDRHPRLPLGPRAGHPHRRDLLARGPLRPAPLQGRRGLSRRQARRADPRVPRHRRHRRARARSTASTRSIPATASSPRTPHFARACAEAGITFVGPRPEVLEQLGDKIAARAHRRRRPSVPVLSGSDDPVDDDRRSAASSPRSSAIPVIVKAAMGGGGRGMRVVHDADELDDALEQARREAGAAFGSRRRLPREVRPAGQAHRSAAARRPARQPGPPVRARLLGAAAAPEGRRDRPGAEPRPPTCGSGILDAALAVGRAVGIDNAGTVEFLVDADASEFYFIEVNPRIQVEHTVTEEVTGYRHRRVADPDRRRACRWPTRRSAWRPGRRSARTASRSSAASRPKTRRTTSCPTTAGSAHYRSAGGMGIRLDAGTAFARRGHHAVLRLAAGEGDRRAACASSTPPGGWSAACRSSASAA